MKTNKEMTRDLDGFKVVQQIKDGKFNATALVEQWNKSIKTNKKYVPDYLSLKSTKEFLSELEGNSLTEENLYGDNQQVAKMTGRMTKAGRTKDVIWLSPLAFLDFAMWLNPRFKVKVLRFVYDQLIEQRHAAGDNYKKLASSIARLKGVDYSVVAKTLNWIVFGKHENGIRNTASDEQLKKLQEIENYLSLTVDTGLITTYDQLMTTMRRMCRIKQPLCGL